MIIPRLLRFLSSFHSSNRSQKFNPILQFVQLRGDDMLINETEYKGLIAMAKEDIAQSFGTDSTSDRLMDQFSTAFESGSSMASVNTAVTDLLEEACKLNEINHHPAAPAGGDHATLSVDLASNSNILQMFVNDDIVRLKDSRDKLSCSQELKPNMEVIEQMNCPKQGAVFTPSNIVLSSHAIFSEKFKKFFLHDCNLITNGNQIFKDMERIDTVTYGLYSILVGENHSTNSNMGEKDRRVPATPPFGDSTSKLARGLAHAALERVVSESLGTGSELLKSQFESELSIIFDICAEVNLIYTIYGRNRVGASFSGRQLPGDRPWRLYKYPYEDSIIPFLFYQGMMTTCAYLLLFSRVPNPGLGVPVNLPSPFLVYNVFATMVEQVSDVPLGDTKFVSLFYKWIVNTITPQICKLVERKETDCPVSDNIGRSMMSYISASAVVHKTEAVDANLKWLPNVWSLAFEYEDSGLIGIFFASYLTHLQFPHDNIEDVSLLLLHSLYYLDQKNRVPEMLNLASRILNHKEYVLNNGTEGTFTQFLDETIAAFADEYRPETHPTIPSHDD